MADLSQSPDGRRAVLKLHLNSIVDVHHVAIDYMETFNRDHPEFDPLDVERQHRLLAETNALIDKLEKREPIDDAEFAKWALDGICDSRRVIQHNDHLNGICGLLEVEAALTPND